MSSWIQVVSATLEGRKRGRAAISLETQPRGRPPGCKAALARKRGNAPDLGRVVELD